MEQVNDNKRGRRLASPAYVRQVQRKVESGEYPTHNTKCICGAEHDTLLLEKDRYGFPHRMVICNECALIRANPMMTAEAYTKFYNNEYRMINCPTFNTAGATKEADYVNYYDLAKRKGERIIQWLEDTDIDHPKVVVDIGCHVGGMLGAFKEKGSITYGVEIDDSARSYAREQGHVAVASVEELESLGVKADLVIMYDVIEHYVDLNDVRKVANILAPEGKLYVYTPGIFRNDLRYYFQMAHTYQFCARSLEWVMGFLGFEALYEDEEVFGLWEYKGDAAVRYAKPTEWAEYVKDAVFDKPERKMPRFRGTCKFSKKLLNSNIEANLAAKIPDLHEITLSQCGDAAIVAGGPSIDEMAEELRSLYREGVPIIAIARMLPWCLDHGITPEYVVSVDCSEEQEKSFERCPSDTTYLLASVTRPEILAKLKGEKCYIFDNSDEVKIKKLRQENGYKACTVISSLGTVALTSLSIGMNLGFKRFHVFGLDLMFKDAGHTHAAGIAGNSVQQHPLEVTIGDEKLLTTGAFLDFANQALDLVSVGHEDGLLDSVQFYGDSIINRMWDGKWGEDNV